MISTARKEDIIPIPTREVPAARKRAANGDIKAINKLIGYYLQHDEDAEAQKWSHRRDEILACLPALFTCHPIAGANRWPTY